jgi:hypothetical protein
MRRLVLTVSLVLALGRSASGIFVGMPVDEQYNLAGHVVQATALEVKEVLFGEEGAVKQYALVYFEISEEFKGDVRTSDKKEGKKRIAVAVQTSFDEFGPRPPRFAVGKEYFLFLSPKGPDLAWHSNIFVMVTDGTGTWEVGSWMLDQIRELQAKAKTRSDQGTRR